MKKLPVCLTFFFVLILICTLTSCSNEVQIGTNPAETQVPKETPRLDPVETFTEDESPLVTTFNAITVTGPWGYSRAENSSRYYPLVVAGMHGEGEGQYNNVNKLYPAFVIVYRKDGYSDGQALAEWIDAAKAAGYRIDANRIYLTGFSQGGSGSFPLAKGMQNKGKYFAAIVRVAGQSQSDLTSVIAEKTAVWYHLGLNDTQARVDVARATLANFRAYACNADAEETSVNDSITGYERTTVTLTRAGKAMFKYSEYTGMGHSASACYKDEDLFRWVFARTLAGR